MSILGFQMWEPFRQNLMAEHCFYVEQAQKRLLSQFDNIETEADKAAEEYLDKMSAYFNPDIHDPSDFYESANDKGNEFYQLLNEMHEITRLSVIAGMFHQWDKKLRDWIAREIRHWHLGNSVTKVIWKADFPAIVDFLVSVGFDVKKSPCYEQLNAMRLVVNVFKHGDGQSFEELRGAFPKFFPDLLGDDGNHRFPFSIANHTDMTVSDDHLKEFSEAILDFWRAIPTNIYLGEELDAPKWFEKAFLKDIETK